MKKEFKESVKVVEVCFGDWDENFVSVNEVKRFDEKYFMLEMMKDCVDVVNYNKNVEVFNGGSGENESDVDLVVLVNSFENVVNDFFMIVFNENCFEFERMYFNVDEFLKLKENECVDCVGGIVECDVDGFDLIGYEFEEDIMYMIVVNDDRSLYKLIKNGDIKKYMNDE